MRIVELNFAEFDNFAKSHILGSFHQTSSYALLMVEQGFEYDYIGYVDSNNNILAASLILHKKIGLFMRYGYAPKGFLIDYMNKQLLTDFTNELRNYYSKKHFAFIKINPEIAIAEINKTDFSARYNQNKIIESYLKELGYNPLKKDKSFKNKLPVYNAILPLKDFDLTKVAKPTRSNIKNSVKKGLILEHTNQEGIDILYNFIKKKKDRPINFYKDFYNVFNKIGMIDLFLVKTDYKTYLENIKSMYEKELEINTVLSEMLKDNPKEVHINRKMDSDKAITSYKEDMIDATNGMRREQDIYIAGAITIKYQNRINIYISGYDKNYEKLNPNYFLHYGIAEYFKKNYDFVDLNGISGDFDPKSKYYGLNKFKIGWGPKIYEFIGEYDLVINPVRYSNFISSPKLFNKYKEK